MERELITGNTYPVRAELRALGGEWDKGAQGWRVPADKAAAARELVARAPRGGRRARGGGVSTRFSGGATVNRNRRGRCEDAPCCGCCD